ncbi:ankyrin repeat domain-containing protein, putative [Eimeria maxima]|uniref:Ankyrin repeat domain-containing protein, putative n=1 Tax=Eimeria maxima TaxID=5804 RepID=U6MFH2_EIMMA|nr:ankyrin repeat domain-containing protein, putative [Eimeria maxima]CDJ61199.1 ankyrin repeat domain-containing protein, putative [Eimeria maxima]
MTPLHICCAVGCTGGAAAILQYIGNPAAAAATAAAAAAAGAHAAGDAAVAADAAVGKAQNAAAAGAAEDAAAAAAEDAAAAAAAEAAATAAAAAAAAAADEDKPSIKDAINSVTQSGGTPLLYAASKGHLDIVKLLLQHGADVNRKGFGNHTAICRAITAGRKSVVQFLLDVPGIDLTVKETGSADNLLHLAVNSGYADIYWDIADRAPELEDQKNNVRQS